MPDRSEASSSLISRTPSPCPEVKKRRGINVQYPTPPASAQIKHELFVIGRDGRGLGRTTVDNASPRDASGDGIPALTWKKSPFMSSHFFLPNTATVAPIGHQETTSFGGGGLLSS